MGFCVFTGGYRDAEEERTHVKTGSNQGRSRSSEVPSSARDRAFGGSIAGQAEDREGVQWVWRICARVRITRGIGICSSSEMS